MFQQHGSLSGIPPASLEASAQKEAVEATAINAENALNLKDPWARIYLTRGCAEVLHSGAIAGELDGVGAPFWQALLIVACCDESISASLSAIRSLAGAAVPQVGRNAGCEVGGFGVGG